MPDPSPTVFDDVGYTLDPNGSPASRWLIETAAIKAIDAVGGPRPTTMVGQLLQQYPGLVDWRYRSKARNQQFRLAPVDASAGIYTIVADHSGRVFDIFVRPTAPGQPDQGRGPGSLVGLWPLTYAPWQLWYLVPRTNDDRLIVASLAPGPAGEALVLDVRGGSDAEGAVIQVWSPKPENKQQWFRIWRQDEAGRLVVLDPVAAIVNARKVAAQVRR